MRLTKYLQAAQVTSRRVAENLILQGKVTVQGKCIKQPHYQVKEGEEVRVEGHLVTPTQERVLFMLNKPKGYVCSHTVGRKKVIDLFADEPYRLFTVGRLDKDTEGLLLVTNDGDLANAIIHPSSNITKEYVAKTNQEITHPHLLALSKGCLVEKTKIVPLKVKKVRRGTLKIVIAEGKKREIRKLLSHCGLETLDLKRTRIGGLSLGNLPVGHYKLLGEKEIKALLYPN